MKDKIVEILESEFGKGYDTSHSLNKYMYDIAEDIDALYSAGEEVYVEVGSGVPFDINGSYWDAEALRWKKIWLKKLTRPTVSDAGEFLKEKAGYLNSPKAVHHFTGEFVIEMMEAYAKHITRSTVSEREIADIVRYWTGATTDEGDDAAKAIKERLNR